MSAAVYRGCVVSGGNAAMLWTVAGGVYAVYGLNCSKLAEQLVVGLIQQLLKVKQIRRTVAATFTASQERFDSFEVRRRGEASPCGRGVHQPRHHYCSEDSAGQRCSYRGAVGRAGHTATARCH